MPRLGKLPPRLATIAPAIKASTADDDQWRAATSPWRAWYNTARWRALRIRTIWQGMATCTLCGATDRNAQTFINAAKGDGTGHAAQVLAAMIAQGPITFVADHIIPHRGDGAMFWDPGNLQCVCKPCHDGAKQRAEAAGRRRQALERGGGGGESLGRPGAETGPGTHL
jgi:5-methylcytosine-specific restriction enzyme A